jgi:tetratricopeptide (TPR) repeat protein
MVTSRIALAYAYVGDLAHAERDMTEAVALYHEANEPSREAMVLHNLASVMTEQGKLADAERAYRRTVEGAHAADMRELETLALANLAVNLLRQGELSEARSSARSAVALSRETGDARRMVFALATLGQILLRMGELDDARKAIEEARDKGDEIGATATPVGQYLAELTAAEGDLEGAEALARRAAADYRQKKMAIGEVYALTVDARLLFRLGRTADATEASTRMRTLAEQIGFDHVREEVAAPLALARAASGDVPGAITDLESAIAQSARLHLVDANLAQRLVLGGLEYQRGRPAAAHRILADLEVEARRRGFHQLVKEIQALRSVTTTAR